MQILLHFPDRSPTQPSVTALARLRRREEGSRSAATEHSVRLKSKAGNLIANRTEVVRRKTVRSGRPAVANGSIWISRSTRSTRNRRAAGYPARGVGLARVAAVSNRKHIVVGIQNFRVSSIAARRNCRSSCTALGTDCDCQNLSFLDCQDGARVSPTSRTTSAVARDDCSASAGAIQFNAQPINAARHGESA